MKKFKVTGMHCASCAISLESILKNLESTNDATVNYSNQILYLDSSNIEEAQNIASKNGYELQEVNLHSLNLKIGGISCASCVSSIETTLQKMNEVHEVHVSLPTKTAYIEYYFNKEKIINRIEEIGFSVNEEIKEKNEVPKLILLSILGVLLFIISMFPMLHIRIWDIIDPHTHLTNNLTLQLILTCFILYLTRNTLISGYKKLILKIPNMDSLIFIGVSASFIYSVFIFIHLLIYPHSSHPMLYFESAGMILVFVSIGKYFEEKNKVKSFNSLKSLLTLNPQFVELKNGENKHINEVQIGDIIIVKPGNRLSLDGEIVYGNSFIDEKFLTGESIPNEKVVGDKVYAGTINQNGYFEYKVEKENQNSVISKIVEMVENAQINKAPIARIADIISGYFVWGTLILSLIVFTVWMIISKNFTTSLNFVISILVIACPCALGLATPMAILIGSTKASQNQILFKKASSIQALSTIDTVVFDKTGTITSGNPTLVNQVYFSDEPILQIVASIEKASEHPLGKAILKQAENENIDLIEVEQFNIYTSKGISGKVNGNFYHIGNIKLMQDFNVDISHQSLVNSMSQNGESIIYIAKENQLIALFGIKDEIKPGIETVLEYLRQKKIHPIIVSGDQHLSVKAIANQLKINDFKAEVFPEDKHQFIIDLKSNGRKVAMIGDGINDSIALSSADVGIAIGNGSEIAIDSADIILMRSNIIDLAVAIDLSKSTLKNVYENLFWAFIYNTIGILLASGLLIPFGLTLHPMFAAFAMSISSISVVLNALRLLNYKFKQKN